MLHQQPAALQYHCKVDSGTQQLLQALHPHHLLPSPFHHLSHYLLLLLLLLLHLLLPASLLLLCPAATTQTAHHAQYPATTAAASPLAAPTKCLCQVLSAVGAPMGYLLLLQRALRGLVGWMPLLLTLS
jgi:hypothetical protein